MAKVEITATPPGQAPEWVRAAWVGLTLPVAEGSQGGVQMGVHGGVAENQGGISVPTEQALEILEAANAEAAEWWYENLPIMPSWLVFNSTVCRFIEE